MNEKQRNRLDEIMSLALKGVEETDRLPLEYPVAEGAVLRAILHRIRDLAETIYDEEVVTA